RTSKGLLTRNLSLALALDMSQWVKRMVSASADAVASVSSRTTAAVLGVASAGLGDTGPIASGFPFRISADDGSSKPRQLAARVSIWDVYQGERTATAAGKSDERVTLFVCKRADGEHDERLECARNQLRKLRMIRHPNTLRFIDGVEGADG